MPFLLIDAIYWTGSSRNLTKRASRSSPRAGYSFESSRVCCIRFIGWTTWRWTCTLHFDDQSCRLKYWRGNPCNSARINPNQEQQHEEVTCCAHVVLWCNASQPLTPAKALAFPRAWQCPQQHQFLKSVQWRGNLQCFTLLKQSEEKQRSVSA